MPLKYRTVDVFTRQKFSGNQLAVVWGVNLDDNTMQKLAAEFNYSETTFLQPAENSGHTAKVRIFTPTSELAFAGHPNIGTAMVLANYLADYFPLKNENIIFEEKAGLVAIQLWYENKICVGARLQAPQKFSMGKNFPPELIAASVNLPLDAISTKGHLPL